MTWRLDDHGGSKRPAIQTPIGIPTGQLPQEPSAALTDAEDPMCSVFEAMQVEEEGFWGRTAPERLPHAFEQDLWREHGMVPARVWESWRRVICRDTEAV